MQDVLTEGMNTLCPLQLILHFVTVDKDRQVEASCISVLTVSCVPIQYKLPLASLMQLEWNPAK